MVDVNAETSWIAVLAALFGGAGLKLVEGILGRQESNFDIGAALREELRTEKRELEAEITTLRDEIESIHGEVERWREKYYSLLLLFFKLQNETNDPDILNIDLKDL